VFDRAVIRYAGPDPIVTEGTGEAAFVARHGGQVVETTVELPATPPPRRIVLSVDVDPVLGADGHPVDPWTRLGSVGVVVPPGSDAARGLGVAEIELMRFATGYGGTAHFEMDVTALAPWLHGRRTLRAFVSTYAGGDAWQVTADLHYEDAAGARRPTIAIPVFNDPHVARDSNFLRAWVSIPAGLDRPRIRIITTGHATDGAAENEFVTCPHVLRVDERVVARWRPWTEGSTANRPSSPWAGRHLVDGQEVRSSDLDRSGWAAGRAVEPLLIPLDELTPGRHEITLAVQGIRPAEVLPDSPARPHGYFVVSAVVVADAPLDPAPAPADGP
jgi:hypothetical protein